MTQANAMRQPTGARFENLAMDVRITSTLREPTREEEREASRARRDYGATYWTVRLTYKGRRMATPFHMGSGHSGEPTAAQVLSCLISDNESVKGARNFSEWAADMGWDDDSRRAESTFKACQALGAKVERLLGADYQQYSDLAQDY